MNIYRKRKCQYCSFIIKLFGTLTNVFFFLLVTVISSCRNKSDSGQPSGARPGSQPIVVEAIVAKVRSISHTITVSGTLIPFEETTLMPEVGGRVISVHHVTSGQGRL